MIERVYKLSVSSTSRILSFTADINHSEDIEKENYVAKNGITVNAHCWIQSLLQSPACPLTIRSIWKNVLKLTGELYNISTIRLYIKKILKYSYKKASCRPIKFKSAQSQLKRGIFAVEMLRAVLNKKLVINIDEWSFERSLVQSYSWLPKGENATILNNPSKGKASLIIATISDGNWFAFVKHGTVDSRGFWVFMKLLSKLIEFIKIKKKNKVVVTLDNAPTHKSRLTANIANSLNLLLDFLPPYSPDLAPVELIFGAIKNRMRSIDNSNCLDFDSKTGVDEILATWSSFDFHTWHGAWMKVIKTWSLLVNNLSLDIEKYLGMENFSDSDWNNSKVSA